MLQSLSLRAKTLLFVIDYLSITDLVFSSQICGILFILDIFFMLLQYSKCFHAFYASFAFAIFSFCLLLIFGQLILVQLWCFTDEIIENKILHNRSCLHILLIIRLNLLNFAFHLFVFFLIFRFSNIQAKIMF